MMINVQGPKITQAQIKILLGAVAVVTAAVLFHLFVCQPSAKGLEVLRAKNALLESQLSWVNQVIFDVKDPEKVAGYFMNEQRELARKFPVDEAKSLLMLSEYAQKFRVHLEQVSAEPPRMFKGSRRQVLKVDGMTCSSVYVRLKMKADYMNLIKYLEALRKVLPAPLVIEKMDAVNRAPATPQLEVNMEMSLYLLEPQHDPVA